MSNKAKLALAAALISSAVIGAASSALASNDNDGGNETGGYVVPGSLDGVNPVYHPGIFGNPAVARSYGFYQSRDGSWHVRPDWHWGMHP